MPATMTRRGVRLQEREAGVDRVDTAAGVIRGVKVLGTDSKNGRRYPLATMRRALTLYEGAEVCVDHVGRASDRSARDGVGILRNVRVESSGMFADLHLYGGHPDRTWIMEKARMNPRGFGLSHDARGDFDPNGEVRRIHGVESVDLVHRPATNVGLFESIQDGGEYEHVRRSPGRGWDPGCDDWRERI